MLFPEAKVQKRDYFGYFQDALSISNNLSWRQCLELTIHALVEVGEFSIKYLFGLYSNMFNLFFFVENKLYNCAYFVEFEVSWFFFLVLYLGA